MRKIGFLFMMIFLLFIPQMTFAADNKQLIIINKSTNQLAFFDNGEIVRTFPVATGKKDSYTPEGTFPIVNKIKNRPYYSGGIPGGSPKNPLGDRWLGLNARGTYGTTYAIHGNNNPNSIGKYVSAGCIRMYNEDVRWLFDRVNVGTNVVILHSSKSFDQIAKDYGYKLTPPITIRLDGKQIYTDVEPFVKNGSTLVPVRAISTAIGGKVEWDQSTQTVTVTKKWDTVKLQVNSKTATINEETHELVTPAVIQQGRTFVPIRFISEAFGVDVKWDNNNRIVQLTSPKPPVRTPIDVTINGHMIEKGGFIEGGVSLVQIAMFNSLGIPPQFEQETLTATVSYGETTIVATAYKKEIMINEETVSLQKPTIILNGRLYVPARALVEKLNGTIQFDATDYKVEITLPE